MPFLYPVLSLILIAIIAWFVNKRMPAEVNFKPIVNIVMSLIIIGIVLWLINTYIPMAGAIKAILNIVVVIATCVFVLKAFGLWSEVVRLWTDLTSRLSAR
jgi:membrane-bound ClpP family serine protease